MRVYGRARLCRRCRTPPGTVSRAYGHGQWPGAAFVLLTALHYRDRTGEGQFIEFAQSENMLPHLGEFFLDAQMNQRDACPMGNHHPRMAPHNVYPCTGKGTWVTIAVADDTEWQRLCEALGQPDWAM